jgi:hypothetical protein
MYQAGDIISYVEMCRQEGISLQRDMTPRTQDCPEPKKIDQGTLGFGGLPEDYGLELDQARGFPSNLDNLQF